MPPAGACIPPGAVDGSAVIGTLTGMIPPERHPERLARVVRFAYRPFDNRWLYWEKDTKLLDRKRADYKPHVFEGNLWLSAAQHLRKAADEPQACRTEHLGSLHLIERGGIDVSGLAS